MVSVIITAYREPDTIGPAITALLPQLPSGGELLVVCPDPETTAVVRTYATQHPQIRHATDAGRGKPAAINTAQATAHGDILVFTDGDVRVGEQALAPLLAPFADERVAAVTGRPVSISPRRTKLGYWSHLLIDAAHQVRLRRHRASDFLLCSGYLFAVRASCLTAVPEDALAEDAVISHRLAGAGWRIAYAPEAEVYVKYPTTYRDWLRQKVRSTGGYAQEYVRQSAVQMRSARREIIDGPRLALQFAQSPRELWWTLQLFAARLHLWLLVFWQVRVRQRPLAQLWQRVESTK